MNTARRAVRACGLEISGPGGDLNLHDNDMQLVGQPKADPDCPLAFLVPLPTLVRMSDVTQLLDAIQNGDARASDQLLPLVYEELRKLAAVKMAQEKPGQTLQATALVHEAWMRLAGTDEPKAWNSRGHFFGAAAEAMRRILVDRARQKARLRHGGDLERVDLEHVTMAVDDSDDTVLAIHEVLEKLALESPQKAEIVKLRYFAGMEHAEIAQSLGVSEPTVRRHWAYARAWLYAELKKNFQNT
jgi:RNA polymerase sigma factor (TIGR02999 family)